MKLRLYCSSVLYSKGLKNHKIDRAKDREREKRGIETSSWTKIVRDRDGDYLHIASLERSWEEVKGRQGVHRLHFKNKIRNYEEESLTLKNSLVEPESNVP